MSGRYVFTEGFFVFRNKNYLEYTDDAFKIKKITKDFFEKAVLKIKKYNVADNFKEKDVSSSALFSKVHDGVKIIEFKPYLERKRETGDDETTGELVKRFEENFYKVCGRQKTANEIMFGYVKSAGWNSAIFEEKTYLNPMDFTRLKKREYRFKKEAYVAMSVALGLSLNETEDVLKRAGYAFSEINRADAAYMFILSAFPSNDIDMANEFLRSIGVCELGAKSRDN